MAATQAEVMISFLDYLNDLDERIGTLLRTNRDLVVRTDAHIRDSFSQMGRPDKRRPEAL